MRYFLAVILLSALVACAQLTPLEQVESAEEKWKASGIQNYDFTLDIYSLVGGAPCASGRGPIDVRVRNGLVVKFGTCSPDAQPVRQFGTVPDIFETIRANLKERPPRYRVRFNPSLGYPESIDADYFRFATDSTAQYSVRDFHVIQ